MVNTSHHCFPRQLYYNAVSRDLSSRENKLFKRSQRLSLMICCRGKEKGRKSPLFHDLRPSHLVGGAGVLEVIGRADLDAVTSLPLLHCPVSVRID